MVNANEKEESERGDMSPTFAAPTEAPTPIYSATTGQDETLDHGQRTQSDTEQKASLMMNPTMMSIIEESQTKPSVNEKTASKDKRVHPVPGYSNSENMW